MARICIGKVHGRPSMISFERMEALLERLWIVYFIRVVINISFLHHHKDFEI